MVDSNGVKSKWMIHLVKCLDSRYVNQQVTLIQISVVTLSASSFSSMLAYWDFLETAQGENWDVCIPFPLTFYVVLVKSLSSLLRHMKTKTYLFPTYEFWESYN